MSLEKTYNHQDFELKIYTQWLAASTHLCAMDDRGSRYSVMMPPPNVTGSLHIGHALNYTLQDALCRYQRMRGADVLWQPGTDHAGIATQMVVERQLADDGISRHALGREAFLEKVWAWKAYSGDTIVTQQKRLGILPDWTRARFTLDGGLNRAVNQIFVRLYRDGLIYRDKRLVNWDTKLQTAISDLEVENREVDGSLWYIRYPLADDPTHHITVATTRPETMLGDVAVAVHPDDDRYQAWIGKMVRLPLTDRMIPIVADEYCDPEKGSGAVKITPAHDFNDNAVGRRHNLPMINILDAAGHLNTEVPKPYQGLFFAAARKALVADLEAQGLLEKIEPIKHMVPYGDRSGVVVQPWLTDQWYVDAAKLAGPALKAVQDGRTQFVPQQWTATYYEWLENIQPWCISRQIWWGHQIPAWYGPDGQAFVALTEEEAVAQATVHYGTLRPITRDADVLDTWFSSALWPFSTLGWPDQTPELARYYPTDVLVTGFDIIFFWVARMMMMGLYVMDEVPFKTVYVHALVRDEKGQKMSKSKGNVIDPLELMDKYGADAMRFTLMALSVPGRDLKMSEARIAGYRNFMTKIWNAARFLEFNACQVPTGFDPTKKQDPLQQWIYAELADVVTHVDAAFAAYRFDDVAHHLYHFFWGTYCDYYLEFSKAAFQDSARAPGAKAMALYVFQTMMQLLHPFIPYITEHLWANACGRTDILAQSSWPNLTVPPAFQAAREGLQQLVMVIQAVRSLRVDIGLSPSEPVRLVLATQASAALDADVLSRMAKVAQLDFVAGVEDLPRDGFGVQAGDVVGVVIPTDVSGVRDVMQRLRKDLEKLDGDLLKVNSKLSNQDFVARAPAHVVAEHQEQQSTLMQQRQKLLQLLGA